MTQVPGVTTVASVTELELPRGLALNRFRLICPGLHQVTRLPRPKGRDERREIEKSIGYSIFVTDEFGYTDTSALSPDSELVEFQCNQNYPLHLFDIRNCISKYASHKGFTTKFGFGGELQIAGLGKSIELDGLYVQRRLHLRVGDSADSQESWIVARHDTRYLVSGSLGDADIRSRAVGETAERIRGQGPLRGEVLKVESDKVTLRNHGEEVSVEPSDYTLTVRSSYVRRYHAPETLTKLQSISGSLTEAGQRNRYAVKDRYRSLIEDMEQLGWSIPMPKGRQITIERSWAEIRIQAGSI